MSEAKKDTIYTIGHSNREWDEFIEMLQSFDIQCLVDIRHYPHSRKFPYFNTENFAEKLPGLGIEYTHMVELGGRRNVQPDSKNTRWRNASFQGYADYMETPEFKKAAAKLEAIAVQKKTAYMCSEAVWWRCHRSMVSDYLKAKGWEVLHIMSVGKVSEHPYTSPAIVQGDKVCYSDECKVEEE